MRWSHSIRHGVCLFLLFAGTAASDADVTSLSVSQRFANTSATLDQLRQSSRAILLENAWIDTALPIDLGIPDILQADANPSAYIVQCRGRIDRQFRDELTGAGAHEVGYIPNNALLVRASAEAARVLAGASRVQAVAPFEPAYKLKSPLLDLVLRQDPLPETEALNLLVFSDGREETARDLERLGVTIVGEERSPFGVIYKAVGARQESRPPGFFDLAALARLPGVQGIELARAREAACDLSRTRLGVAVNAAATNYLGLSGTNVLVSISDSGVDVSHPALANRVVGDRPLSTSDTNGHGTFIAGVIAGDGAESLSVANAPGSAPPFAARQFRGLASGARLFSMSLSGSGSNAVPDVYLQETAARTNALVANHSWLYAGANGYDFAAASYDAAVRDCLPEVSGVSPLCFVFPAGNGGDEMRDSVQSPGTAKNVITVGAIEQLRSITNQTWFCATNPAAPCVTNAPWLSLTDSSDEVCSFSARGNTGVGIESEAGRRKPDLVAPGSFLVSTRAANSSPLAGLAPFPSATNLGTGNCLEVYTNLDAQAGPYYRFGSGTSVAAAHVSGLLALMHEFFNARWGWTYSPALMKALLINSARSLGAGYDFMARGATNSQGWGLPSLTNALPASFTNHGFSPIILIEQNAAAVLGTGQSHTWPLTVAESAQGAPLRFTLVWTDPPGNPLAASKLVNDLDLIVTNLDTGEVYVGNDFGTNGLFSRVWEPGAGSSSDRVNNVENVYLAVPGGTNFSVTILGAAVNVNAVTAQSNRVAQDYALVISSGNGGVAEALTISNFTSATHTPSPVTVLTNSFAPGLTCFGQVLLSERIGAHPPMWETNFIPMAGSPNTGLCVGDSNQWRFYVISNATPATNAAFVLFETTSLGLSAVDARSTNTSVRWRGGDVDLYVSRDPALIDLDATALAAADRSVGRGDSEWVVYTNAGSECFYLAVKCESRSGADFGLAGVFCEWPFSEIDLDGNQVVHGFPGAVAIPDGATNDPGVAFLFGIATEPITIRRVAITNILSHPSTADLEVGVEREGTTVTLLCHEPGAATNRVDVFDDSLDPLPGARHSKGPGELRDFSGRPGGGLWLGTAQDRVPGATGTVSGFDLFLERQLSLTNGVELVLSPGTWHEEFLDVPVGTTNLQVMLALESTGTVQAAFCSVIQPEARCETNLFIGPGTNQLVLLDRFSDPPLNPGLYVVRMGNATTNETRLVCTATLGFAEHPPLPFRVVSSNSFPILDDALSRFVLNVETNARVRAVEAGVQIEHPRVSDLAISLVSPSGKRVLLAENRGGASSDGMGSTVVITNVVPVSSSGGPEASTNRLNTGQTVGTLILEYEFFSLPDSLRVYYETNLLLDTGLVSWDGETNINYGPGDSKFVTIVVNEGGNFDTNTAWAYTATWAHPEHALANFTENTRLTQTPIKFAIPPLTNATYVGPHPGGVNAFYYLPEVPLTVFNGDWSQGVWTLEILDTVAGETVPAPTLVAWQLAFHFDQTVPAPVPLAHGQTWTNMVGSGQLRTFAVEVPDWAQFASNFLSDASAPLNLWYNSARPPVGDTHAGDVLLLGGTTAGVSVLGVTNTVPPLVPGVPCYLGVANTNAAAATFSLRVEFDVQPLHSGIPVTNTVAATQQWRYYSFDVSTNATAVSFELLNPSGNVTLVASRGLPFPDLTLHQAASANPGASSESIILFPNSSPTPLSPGRWFLGVFHEAPIQTTFTALGTEYSNAWPVIVTLDDGVPVTASNGPPAAAADCYRFVVTTNAVRAQFEILGSSADMLLVAKKGLPLPDQSHWQFRSDNPWTNRELIVVYSTSSPIPLTPGEWFLAAINQSAGPVNYGVKAVNFGASGLGFAITNFQHAFDRFCLTWESLPGVSYYIEGSTNLALPNWTALSGTLLAVDSATTWCLELPSPYQFFRVREGLVLGPCLASPVISSVKVVTNGVQLQWAGPICATYEVQATPSLTAPVWTSFTNWITTTNAWFSFLDPGAPGPATNRFYRLRQVEIPQ